MEKIINILSNLIEGKTMIKMVFGSQRKKSLPYSKVIIRPVVLKEKLIYQLEYHYKNKVIHENISQEELLEKCRELIIMDFKQLNIFAVNEDIQILASNPSNAKILKSAPSKEATSLDHNKTKKYILQNGVPYDFLIRLGVSDDKGKVFQKHYSKFRQINRFLEIVDDSFHSLDTSKKIKIIDFGCGKSYLTFALYHYFGIIKQLDVEIIGLDLKEDVINFCNHIASELKYTNLKFLLGDIADYKSDGADIVVSLHACDTATDYALINAVKWGSQIILAVPCCQHQLFDQISEPINQPILKHGLLKDRFTEILTDGVRGLKLEASGYDVSMIEFTSLEHTSKNIMIKAIKSPNKKKSEEAALAFENILKFWNVNPTITNM